MTVHKLSAGNGYLYYTREVASGDELRQRGRELGDYYTADGNPPGQWAGEGIAALGVSGEVTEAQMKALFGEGLHPEAERIIAERVAAGESPKEAMKAAKLGMAYYRFGRGETVLAQRVSERVAAFERMEHRSPDEEETRALTLAMAGRVFRESYGRGPRDNEELRRFIDTDRDTSTRSAVAGYDLVFAPAKSVSVLWALGDEPTRIAIEAAHESAVADTISYLEREALATRTGNGGIAQEDVAGGMIATRFRHYDSRTGQPQLHDHVVVSNKVRIIDKAGRTRWRSIDGKLLYRMGVSASEHYNTRVIEQVCDRLGLAAVEREVTVGKRPVLEIAGVDTDLIEQHSSRAHDIQARLAELVAAYRRDHGKDPSAVGRIWLAQQATIDTRPAKKTARSLRELRLAWQADAIGRHGHQRIHRLLATARAAAAGLGRDRDSAPERAADLNLDEVARTVVGVVSTHRAVWGRRHMLAEARRQLTAAVAGRERIEDTALRVTELAIGCSIPVTPPDTHPSHPDARRADGQSVYRHRETDLYTSEDILAAEHRVLDAARTEVIPAASTETFERVLADHIGPLDEEQKHLVREFATSAKLVAAGIGPAGAGKTTVLALVADTVRAAGGTVIGLAPSARAAAEMSTALNARADTLARWVPATEQAGLTGRARRVAQRLLRRRGSTVMPALANRGDLIIVDEAGMASTRALAHVVAEAERIGAQVRLIGDPAQLAAVESGGLLRLIAADVGAVELESVWRFRDPDERAASLVLRDGPSEKAFAWYVRNRRITGGGRDTMIGEVFTAWQRDTDAGKTSLMMATDTDTVTELNLLAQAHQVGEGRVDLARTVRLRDTTTAGVGDVIVSRRNNRLVAVFGGRDFVKNGDTWIVEAITGRGDLTVRHTHHGARVNLAARYVARHVELGYAGTVHRGQGATVDTGHALLDASTPREAAYPALTRGRDTNTAHVVCDDGQTLPDVLATIAANGQPSMSATESMRTEDARVNDVGQLIGEYTDSRARADQQRYKTMARAVLGRRAEEFLSQESWPAVAGVLRQVEDAGWVPAPILAAAERDFGTADDIGAVLSWRLTQRLTDLRAQISHLPVEQTDPDRRPLSGLSDEQLANLADLTARRRRRLLTQLRDAADNRSPAEQPITVQGRRHPAWPHRAGGHLTSAQLAEQIHTFRGTVRSSSDRDSTAVAALALTELTREQRLRRAMTGQQRAREDWERHHVDTSARLATPTVTADQVRSRLEREDVIAHRIHAEQRLRALLPDTRRAAEQGLPDPTVDDSGVPEWIAATTGLSDPHMPPSWREHLIQRRHHLAQRLTHMGENLAADPPEWALRGLGPVPAQPARRDHWQQVAAQVATWRRLQQVDGPRALGSEPADDRNQPIWRHLRQQVDAFARSNRPASRAEQRNARLRALAAQRPDTTPGPSLADRVEQARRHAQPDHREGDNEATSTPERPDPDLPRPDPQPRPSGPRMT